MKKYQIAIAGSTAYTRQIAETIIDSQDFEISWILTPSPKKIGRKQILSKNPLHNFAKENNIKTFLLSEKIDKENLLPKIEKMEIDFLLVVDFAYFIPSWLLNLAKIAPLNIHPSLLPKWRGSSPGQFALLFQDFDGKWQGQKIGGQKSAITLMEMNSKLDQGPIIYQEFFKINENWNQKDYYDLAFDLICKNLVEKIISFAKNGKKKYQVEKSISPIARAVKKDDLFIDWQYLTALISGQKSKIKIKNSKLLLTSILANKEFCSNKADQINFINNASKAFSNWPNLWTIVPTIKGDKRMKIFSSHQKDGSLILDQVQIESKNSCQWNDLKTLIKT